MLSTSWVLLRCQTLIPPATLCPVDPKCRNKDGVWLISPKGQRWTLPHSSRSSLTTCPLTYRGGYSPKNPGNKRGALCPSAAWHAKSPPAWCRTLEMNMRPWCFPSTWADPVPEGRQVGLPRAPWRISRRDAFLQLCAPLQPEPGQSAGPARPASQEQRSFWFCVRPTRSQSRGPPAPPSHLTGAQIGQIRLISVPQGKSSEPRHRGLS